MYGPEIEIWILLFTFAHRANIYTTFAEMVCCIVACLLCLRFLSVFLSNNNITTPSSLPHLIDTVFHLRWHHDELSSSPTESIYNHTMNSIAATTTLCHCCIWGVFVNKAVSDCVCRWLILITFRISNNCCSFFCCRTLCVVIVLWKFTQFCTNLFDGISNAFNLLLAANVRVYINCVYSWWVFVRILARLRIVTLNARHETHSFFFGLSLSLQSNLKHVFYGNQQRSDNHQFVRLRSLPLVFVASCLSPAVELILFMVI